MERLLTLPSDIFVHVICPFLSWNDLCDLDISLTSRKLRPLLYEMYPMFCREHAPTGIDELQMVWFFKRNIPITRMSFVSSITDTTLFTLAAQPKQCASLISIDLSYCRKATVVGMISLAQQCLLLSDLNLSYTFLRNESLIAFARTCVHITHLDVGNCQLISDESVQFLAQDCQLLKSLNLSHCSDISHLSLCAISLHSSFLTTLNLCYCRVDDEGIICISSGCPALTSLDLSYSLKTIGDDALISLSLSDQKLMVLNLSCCSDISDDVVMAISTHHSQLRQLDLSDCCHVSDVAVVSLSQSCTSLATLGLAHCDITDDAVISLAEKCPDLTSLDLSYTDITDISVICLSHNCPALTALTLTCCDVTDAAVRALSQGCCQALRVLDLSNCESVTAAAVASSFPQEQQDYRVFSEDELNYNCNNGCGNVIVYW